MDNKTLWNNSVSLEQVRLNLLSIEPKTIFYGAGNNFRSLLSAYDFCGLEFNGIIYDVKQRYCFGHPVLFPDFGSIKSAKDVIITVADPMASVILRENFQALGFNASLITERFPDMFPSAVEVEKTKFNFPVEFGDFEKRLIEQIRNNALTMVSDERLFSTIAATKYAIESGIKGDFVECGVWRGGNAFAAASIFQHYKSDKKVYLYDTFSAFYDIAETKSDVDDPYHIPGIERQSLVNTMGDSFDDVKNRFKKYGLDGICIFVKGDVAKTLLSDNKPLKISVLRLDTDWYNSTLAELVNLYPRVSIGGVLMIDDYGHCESARKATDDYFEGKRKPLFQYIDYTGRLSIKTWE